MRNVKHLKEGGLARLEFSIKQLLVLIKDRLLLNAGYLLGVTLVGSATGFVFWTLAARLYTPEEVGLASSVISIVQLLAGVANLGLGMGLVRFLPESDEPQRLLNSAFTLTASMGLLSGSIYLVGVRQWSPSLQILITKPAYTAGFLIFLIAAGIGILLQMTYLGYREAKYAFWQVIVLNGLRLFFVVALVVTSTLGIVAALAIGMVIADVIGLFIFLPRLETRYRLHLRWSMSVFQRLIPYSIGNYTADLLYRAPILLAPPLALERLGPASSAHAYVAWMIGSLLASPGLALAQSAFAEGSHTPADLRAILIRAGRYAVGVTIPLALIVGAGASGILGIFGKSYTRESATLLRWLATAAPLMALVSLYFSALRVRRRVGELVALSGLVAGITLAIPFFTTEKPNLSSMGLGWLIAQAIVAIIACRHLLFRRAPLEKVGGEEELDDLKFSVRSAPEVLVAIPCYNEASFIAEIVQKSSSYADHIVVVDDGSTDGTAEVAGEAGALVIRHSANLGPGAAARTCLEVGRKSGAKVLVTLDGDGQHNPNEIPDVIAPISNGEADVVIGSRFLGRYINVARYRKFGIDVITFLYNFGVREKITDSQSCFRAYNPVALEKLMITDTGFGFSVETLVQARKAGLRIHEASISCIYHEESHSANPILHGVGVALKVLKYRFIYEAHG